MIVQLLGGVFDGAETDADKDSDNNLAIKILQSCPPRWAIYEKHPTVEFRYRYSKTVKESELRTINKDEKGNKPQPKKKGK